MGVVEHCHLGENIGAATAGINGNKAAITEPTGCRTTFIGMRVNKLDRAGAHLVGIQPPPGIAYPRGVIAGRDEILEKALAYVRGTSK